MNHSDQDIFRGGNILWGYKFKGYNFFTFANVRIRDSKMRVLAQTTTFWPLLSRANAVGEN